MASPTRMPLTASSPMSVVYVAARSGVGKARAASNSRTMSVSA